MNDCFVEVIKETPVAGQYKFKVWMDQDDYDFFKSGSLYIIAEKDRIMSVTMDFEGMRRPLTNFILATISNRKVLIDHIDRDPLNNRKSNLRIVTSSINNLNRSLASNNSTGYKGVTYLKRAKCYCAYLMVSGQVYRSAGHQTPRDAALAYDKFVESFCPTASTNKSLGLL